MSPFSHFLHDLRMRRELRQAELAELVGYEQSYVSALEIGIKGPPNEEFSTRLIKALHLSSSEQESLAEAINASYRKLTIDPDTPEEIYWLLKDLRDKVDHLSPVQIRMMRDVLGMESANSRAYELPRRIKRRRKVEATM